MTTHLPGSVTNADTPADAGFCSHRFEPKTQVCQLCHRGADEVDDDTTYVVYARLTKLQSELDQLRGALR